jgi:hypothetical protein
MLANNSLAKMGHANIQSATTGWAFLDVINGLRHGGISYYRMAREPMQGTHSTTAFGGNQTESAKISKL